LVGTLFGSGHLSDPERADAQPNSGPGNARFETALRSANVYIFSQDRDLRYTWVYSPRGEQDAAEMLGRADEEILPAPEREAIIAAKRHVLETGNPADCEMSYPRPSGGVLFALHIEPTFGADQTIDGILCTAIDISRLRLLESEQHRLTEQLGSALQRYETALRGSNVTVFTQDRSMRYTSISNPLFGRTLEEIIGHTDEDVLPEKSRGAVVGLKRETLVSGQAKDSEVSIDEGNRVRWYDLHLEPLRDGLGTIIGLTCAAVDITERKEGEAHLRLLLRELTHRSKNLLAVIQAMARQTARHTGSVEAFLEQFGARLHALATSHDLLVQESWYGAALPELVRSHLGTYLDRPNPQVGIEGPNMTLKPEAAQSLGLALHELAGNAAKYGALSTPEGRVSIAWRRMPAQEGHGVEILWDESGGPAVVQPRRRGFGTMVIERNLARTLDAEVDLSFGADGVRCRIVIPVTQLLIGRSSL
jgi:PAS domain S-box-containing protein